MMNTNDPYLTSLWRCISAIKVFIPLRSFLLISSFLVPLYQRFGLSYTDIYLLESAWAITIVILEVPGGVFADTHGRTLSLRIGSLLTTLGFSCYLIADSFQTFLVAHICFAIGYCFISGCDRSLAYECYAAMDRSSEYRTFERVSSCISGFSEAAAGLLASLLITYSFYTPFVAQVLLSIGLLTSTFMMQDPECVEKSLRGKSRTTEDIFRSVSDKDVFCTSLLYAALLGNMTHTMVILTPVYYEYVGVPISSYGLLWLLQVAFMGICSASVLQAESLLSRRVLMSLLPCMGISAYLGLALGMSQSVYPCILGFYCIRGMLGPLLHHEIHSLLNDRRRATMFSFMNMAQKLLYAVLGLLVGMVMDAFSLQVALYFSAILYTLLSGVLFILMTSPYNKCASKIVGLQGGSGLCHRTDLSDSTSV